MTLSNGSIYPLGEGAGTVAIDVVNDEPLLLVNSPDWGSKTTISGMKIKAVPTFHFQMA